MRNHLLFRIAIVLVAVCFFSSAGYSQVTTATIYGRVLDPSGAIVLGASVTATNESTSVGQSGVTNDRGEVTITFLPVGTYTISIQVAGFKAYKETGLELEAGQKVDRTFNLVLGEATETVTVTSEAPLLNMVNAQQDIRHGELQIKELPLIKRDYTRLLTIGTGTDVRGDEIRINGLAGAGFTVTVDGTDAAGTSEYASLYNGYAPTLGARGVSIDAIEEVQISKNIFSAEIANSLGGNINLTTKSGTNEFHGTLFENYQAGRLHARNQFASTKLPLTFNQFGGTLGGPILKNKMFAFGSYEGFRLSELRVLTGSVPSQTGRDIVTAALPDMKAVFDFYPLPTSPVAAGALEGFYSGAGALKARDNFLLTRWDYHLNSANLVSVKYTRARPFQDQPGLPWGSGVVRNHIADRVTASFNHIASNWSTESRFGFNKNNASRKFKGWDIRYPATKAAGIGCAFMPCSFVGDALIPDGPIISGEQVIALTKGRHSIKTGAIFDYRWVRRSDETTSSATFTSLADLLANDPASVSVFFGVKQFELTRWMLGGFIQDDIRLTPNLTASVGMRYDYWSVPRERDDRMFNRNGPFGALLPTDHMHDADYLNLGPRAALAWTFDGKTVLRTGFGVFVNPHTFYGPVETVANSPYTPRQVGLTRLEAREFGIKWPVDNAKFRPILQKRFEETKRLLGDVINPDYPNPYSMQWTLGLQRMLPGDMAAEVSYVGTRGVKFQYLRTVNQIDRVTGVRPNPNFGSFRVYDTAESTSYHSMQLSLKKRFSRGLSFDAFHTWANNMSFDRGGLLLGNGPQDNNNLSLERGPIGVRHRFVSDVVYELPVARNSTSRAQRLALAGWQVSGIFNAQTGSPLIITQPNALTGLHRPDFIGSSFKAAVINDGLQYLDPRAFARVPVIAFTGATVRPGTLGRGALEGPGSWILDLSLAKNLYLTETMRLQIRTDMINALNHTAYSGINTNITSALFGRVTSTLGARQIQFNVRLSF
ncbi:MAG: TonB-dependent receptor [Acidimicrobiia bacterium]|nr:TonB-dependent receptor [Acidimicrobiia bacterium]